MTSQDYVDVQNDNEDEDDAVKDIKAGNRGVLTMMMMMTMTMRTRMRTMLTTMMMWMTIRMMIRTML